MNITQQINLEHLLFVDRQCRSCSKIKNLLEDYYLTRKDRGHFPSAYSYECKECTVKRVIKNRKKVNHFDTLEYPDW